MQRRPRSEQRRLDLDDAPTLDPSEEAALDAIRRQLDEEFASGDPAVEAMPERRPRPVSESAERPRPTPPREAVPPRRAGDGEDRLVRGFRESRTPAWARPERFRDERPLAPARLAREPATRPAAQRIPPQWREVQPPVLDDEPESRGLLVTIGVAAGLTGGAAGALLTVLLVAGGTPDTLQRSWGQVVAAARDSGLADIGTPVRSPAPSTDPSDAEARPTARPAPPAAPRRGPVTTSEIPGTVERSAPQSAAAIELRGLVTAGRDAYVRKDYAMAERLFAQAVERSAGDGLLRYHHAIALMGLGRFGEASAQFQNALRLGVDPAVAEEAQRALVQISGGRRRR